jgi:hypothetical protein
MENPNLDEASFQALGPDVTGAFLPVADATNEIAARYGSIGLAADPAKPNDRSVARVVELRRGMKLFKLTHWEEEWARETLSPWWSAAKAFEEDQGSSKALFETAILNQVSFREYIRFASAVTLDWNLLDYYVEIQLTRDVGAFWGQFAPKAGTQGHPEGAKLEEEPSPGGDDTYVHYDSSPDTRSEVYLPDILGGVGAWQICVPGFSKHWIDPDAIVNIHSTDSVALAKHFDVSPTKVAQLIEQGKAVRKT